MSDEVALQAFEEAFGGVETCNTSLEGTALARRPELISNFQMEMLSIVGYSGMLEMRQGRCHQCNYSSSERVHGSFGYEAKDWFRKAGAARLAQRKKRPSRKVSNDMKSLCTFIEKKALEAGMNTADRCLDNVRRMFEAAGEDVSSVNPRKGQLKWRTLVCKIRKRLKARKRGQWLHI